MENHSRAVTFMGMTKTVNPLADRMDAEKKVTARDIMPKAYWTTLKAIWVNMTEEEKTIEYARLNN